MMTNMCQGVSQKADIIKKTIESRLLSTTVNEKCRPKYMHCLLHQLMVFGRV